MMATPSVAIPDQYEDLRQAVRRRFGASARVENIVVPTLGGINRTILFEVVQGSSHRRLVSRQETYAGTASPFLSPAVQFRVMQTAHAHGFPVPEPLFVYDDSDGMGRGYVTAFARGETMPKRIVKAPEFATVRSRLAKELGELLALLHSISADEVGFLEFEPDSVDPLNAQRAQLDVYAEAHPAIELGLRWLERSRPPRTSRTLVHGDFRMGNLMIGAAGVTAVLDWECSHIGSGSEDIGWLCMRAWRFGRPELPVGGVASREPLYDAYRAAGGAPVEAELIRYWEIFGLVRWAIINVMQAHGHVLGGRRGIAFAAMGRNAALIEYDLLMTLAGHYQ